MAGDESTPGASRGARGPLLALALGLGVLVLVDQLALVTVLGDDRLRGNPVAPFAPPLFDGFQHELLAKLEDQLQHDRAAFEASTSFDPELGWCPRPNRVQDGMAFDERAARVAPPAGADEALVGLVGCSFTLGNEVRDDESWAWRLDADDADRRFANFGVGGYGPAQALLRYRRDLAPLDPDEVWLGLFPNSVLRSTSHFPPLYHRWRARTLFFKPRFDLEPDGTLTLRPSPTSTVDECVALIRDPAAFHAALRDDPWVVRARAAYLPDGESWLHRSSLARVLLTLHERGGRDVPARLADPHDSLRRLSAAVVLALRDEVEASGARFRLVVLPSKREVVELSEQGTGHWFGLLDELRAAGVELLDLTPELIAAGVDANDRHWMPLGHYSPSTNAIVAETLARAWPAGRD